MLAACCHLAVGDVKVRLADLKHRQKYLSMSPLSILDSCLCVEFLNVVSLCQRSLQFYHCYCFYLIKDITRLEVKSIFYERAQRARKMLFLTRENIIHLFKPPCNVFFFHCVVKLNVCMNNREKARIDVINIFTSEETHHAGSGGSFV